jgi:hypothetical protein
LWHHGVIDGRVRTPGKGDDGRKDENAHRGFLLGQTSRLELAHDESPKPSSAGMRRQLGDIVTDERRKMAASGSAAETDTGRILCLLPACSL